MVGRRGSITVLWFSITYIGQKYNKTQEQRKVSGHVSVSGESRFKCDGISRPLIIFTLAFSLQYSNPRATEEAVTLYVWQSLVSGTLEWIQLSAALCSVKTSHGQLPLSRLRTKLHSCTRVGRGSDKQPLQIKPPLQPPSPTHRQCNLLKTPQPPDTQGRGFVHRDSLAFVGLKSIQVYLYIEGQTTKTAFPPILATIQHYQFPSRKLQFIKLKPVEHLDHIQRIHGVLLSVSKPWGTLSPSERHYSIHMHSQDRLTDLLLWEGGASKVSSFEEKKVKQNLLLANAGNKYF